MSAVAPNPIQAADDLKAEIAEIKTEMVEFRTERRTDTEKFRTEHRANMNSMKHQIMATIAAVALLQRGAPA